MKFTTPMTVSLFIFLSSMAAFAGGHGDTAGNGGTVMACKPGTAEETLQTYDIYEGQMQRHLAPQMGDASLDYLKKVDMVLSRIPEQNAAFRSELQHYFQEFKTQSEIGDFDLVPVDDTGELILAPGCVIRQAAVQREPMSSVEKRYFLDKKIWDRLDQNSKAALVLHEIVYRLTIVRGHTTSVGARLLNSYLMDPREMATKPCLLTSLQNDMQVTSDLFLKIGDLTVLAGKSSITPTCEIQNATVADGFINVAGQKIIPANIGETSVTYSEGHLQRVLINQAQRYQVGGVVYQLGLNSQGLGELLFDEQNHLVQATVDDINVKIQGHHVQLAHGVLFFAADGTVTGVSTTEGFSQQIDGISFENIKRMDVIEDQVLRLWVPHETEIATAQGAVAYAGLFFFSEGHLAEAMPLKPTVLKIGAQTCLAANANMHFYAGHSISRFLSGADCELKVLGTEKNITPGSLISLNEQGEAISF